MWIEAGAHTGIAVQGRDNESEIERLVRVTTAVGAENTARGCAEADKQCDHGAQNDPQRIAVVGGETVLAIFVLCDAEEHHGDNPCDDGSQHGEGGEERHEDGTYAVVTRAANAKQERKAGETWTKTSGGGYGQSTMRLPAAIGTRMRVSVKL